MKEGEPVLGGPQVTPGNVQPANPGVQPAGFETLQNSQNAQAAPLTPPPSSTFTPNVSLSGAQLNNPTPQPAPVSPPTSTQSQFFAQPTAPNVGDVVLSDTPPQKPKKGLVIAIVLVVLVLAAAIVTLVVVNQNSGNTLFGDNSQQATQLTKEEIYNTLQNFNAQHYSELINIYNDTVGLVPNLRPDEYTAILPYARYMEYFTQSIDDSTTSYDEIKSNIPNYLQDGNIYLQPAKNEIDQSLEAMKYNIDLLDKFYQAYYVPLTQDVKPSTCSKTQNMIDLEQDSNTFAAAESYYLVYCGVVNFLNSNEDPAALQDTIAAPTAASAALLNDLLIEVPSATNAIENSLKELAQ